MTQRHQITVDKTARFFSSGDPYSDTLIYVLHGYGQNARFFIDKFQKLSNNCFIVAPEGLHRFYWEGMSGRVVASWMTSEDREDDIADYIHYLNALHTRITADYSFKRVVVIGFSQGVATAFRWIANGKLQTDQFVIASGMIPPDLDLDQNLELFRRIQLCYISGDQDPYRNEEEVQLWLKRFEEMDIPLQGITFNGGHRIDIPSITKALGLNPSS